MKNITVFTPTYNRAELLQNVYKSLIIQDINLFKWLIVDDGSSDNTQDIIKQWKSTSKGLEIEYHYQENKGKMVAHNNGVSFCNTELFLCLDSDDILMANAISQINTFWEDVKIKLSSLPFEVSGVVAPKLIVSKNTKVPVHQFPKGIKYASLRNLYQNGYTGETVLVYRTNILRQYPFKVFEGEKFVPEASAYALIDDNYKMAIFNRHVMQCEYQADGYTQNTAKLIVNNPQGYSYYCGIIARREKSIIKKFRKLVSYGAYGILAHYSIIKIIKESNYPFISLIIVPFSLLQKYRILRRYNKLHYRY